MASGLPVFATCHGGPLEIIEDGALRFHVDPTDGALAAAKIAEFLERCAADPAVGSASLDGGPRSRGGPLHLAPLRRAMMTLSRIYGFWKFVSNLERQETPRYLEMFYPSSSGRAPRPWES